MGDQVLRDRLNRTIGKITESGGKLQIRDRLGRLKGTYDPKTNITKDAMNRTVGKGNLLATLL